MMRFNSKIVKTGLVIGGMVVTGIAVALFGSFITKDETLVRTNRLEENIENEENCEE
jgi:hypothetical protein